MPRQRVLHERRIARQHDHDNRVDLEAVLLALLLARPAVCGAAGEEVTIRPALEEFVKRFTDLQSVIGFILAQLGAPATDSSPPDPPK